MLLTHADVEQEQWDAYKAEINGTPLADESIWIAGHDTAHLTDDESESVMAEENDVEPGEARERANQEILAADALARIAESKLAADQQRIRYELSIKRKFPAVVEGRELSIGDDSCPPIVPGDPSVVWLVPTDADAIAARSLGYVATLIVVKSAVSLESQRVKNILDRAKVIAIIQNHLVDETETDADIPPEYGDLFQVISENHPSFSLNILTPPAPFKTLSEMVEPVVDAAIPAQAVGPSVEDDAYTSEQPADTALAPVVNASDINASCPSIWSGDRSVIWLVHAGNEAQASAAMNSVETPTIIVIPAGAPTWLANPQIAALLERAQSITIVQASLQDAAVQASFDEQYDELSWRLRASYPDATVMQARQPDIESGIVLAPPHEAGATQDADLDAAAAHATLDSVRDALAKVPDDLAAMPKVLAQVALFGLPAKKMQLKDASGAALMALDEHGVAERTAGGREKRQATGAREHMVGLRLACGPGVGSFIYTGQQLGTEDETVYLACIRLSKKQLLGERVFFRQIDLLRECGMKQNAPNWAAIQARLDRLATARFVIDFARDRKQFHVAAGLLNWGVQQDTGELYISLDAEGAELFGSLAQQPWAERLALPSNISARLLTYICSQDVNKLHTVGAIELQVLLGYKGQASKFRDSCLDALHLLGARGILMHKSIVNSKANAIGKSMEYFEWYRTQDLV